MACTCKHFTRGTTPSLVFDMNIHLDNVEEFNITFVQLNTVVLEKNKNDIIFIDENSIKLILSEEDTKLFSDKYDAKCQFRIKYINGAVATSEPPLIFKVDAMLHEV